MKTVKKPRAWMVVVALLLLVSTTKDVIDNLHQGWVRILGFYPLVGAEAFGYDLVKSAELLFVFWVAYGFVRGSIRTSPEPPQNPSPPREG
jgi:hypothetical protein